MLQSFFIPIMSEQSERTDSPVYFGGYDTLREKSAAHSHFVVLPLFYEPVYIQRSKQRDILLCQVIHDIVSHAPVRHIDDCRGGYRINLVPANEAFHTPYRINDITRLLQFPDKVCRFAHHTSDYDTGSSLLQQPVFLQESIVSGYRIETEFFIIRLLRVGMIYHIIGTFCYSFRFVYRNKLAVDMLTYIIQHATVVTAPAIPQVTSQSVGLDRVQRNYLIGRIGDGSGQNGQAAIGSLLYLRTLFFRYSHPHGIDKYHVIRSQLIQFVGTDFCYLYKRIIISLGYLSETDNLIIDKCYSCRTEP